MLVDLTSHTPLLDASLVPEAIAVAVRDRDDQACFWCNSGKIDPYVGVDRERERNEHDWLVFYLLLKAETPHWALSVLPDAALTYEIQTVRDSSKRFWLLRVGRRGDHQQLVRLPSYKPNYQPPDAWMTRKHVARLLRP